MSKFKYRMENILNINEKLEKQAQIRFSKAQEEFKREDELLENLKIRRTEYENNLKSLMAGDLNLSAINNNKAYVYSMSCKVDNQNINVKKSAALMEKERQILSSYNIERKKHEKLKERALDIYKSDESKEEMKEIDEMLTFKNGKD